MGSRGSAGGGGGGGGGAVGTEAFSNSLVTEINAGSLVDGDVFTEVFPGGFQFELRPADVSGSAVVAANRIAERAATVLNRRLREDQFDLTVSTFLGSDGRGATVLAQLFP